MDNGGLSAAVRGNDTDVEARSSRRRTELRKYGISNGHPLASILPDTLTGSEKRRNSRDWHATCSTNLGDNFRTLGMNFRNLEKGFLITHRLFVRGMHRRFTMTR